MDAAGIGTGHNRRHGRVGSGTDQCTRMEPPLSSADSMKMLVAGMHVRMSDALLSFTSMVR